MSHGMGRWWCDDGKNNNEDDDIRDDDDDNDDDDNGVGMMTKMMAIQDTWCYETVKTLPG